MRLAVDEKTTLRSVEIADVDELFTVVDANRAHLRTWLPWVDHTHSPDDTRTFAEKAIENEEAGVGIAVLIEVDGAIVGVVGLDSIDLANRSSEIGYWLGRDAQGRGLMVRCVASVVDYAFATLELNRLSIRAAVENGRSRAVAERLGFREEGVQREAERHADRYVDLACYSMLRGDRR